MLTLYLVLAAILCLLVWFTCIWIRHYLVPVPSLPGALPIIGHIHKLAANYKRTMDYLVEINNMTNELGGITKLWLGPFPMYMITHPEDSLTAMNQAPLKHDLYKIARPWFGQGLLTAVSLPKWKRNRKLLTPCFKPQILAGLMPSLNQQARLLNQSLEEQAGRGFFDHWPHVSQTVFRSLTRSLAIPECDERTIAKYCRIFDELMLSLFDRFKTVIFLDDRLYPFSGVKRRQDGLLRGQADIAPKILGQAEKEIKEAASKPSGGRLPRTVPIVLAAALADGQLTKQEVYDEITTLAVAGYDTSATSLHTVMYLLGLWPDAQEKVYQEVVQVLGDGDVSPNNVDSLVYTEAAVKEALRLVPPVTGTMRNAHKAIRLTSCTIPAGSYVAVAFIGMHRMSSWGDPEEFRPERWLDPAHPPPPAFVPFSLGRRDCIGKKYAMLLQKTMVAHVVRRYRLRSSGQLRTEFHTTHKLAKECTVALELRN